MIEKFNGIIYLIIFLVHFIGTGVYAFQLIIGTKKFREKFDIGNSYHYDENDWCSFSCSIFNGYIHNVY